MNIFLQQFLKPFGLGWRDPVFIWVCEYYLSKINSSKVLTIGAERNLDPNSRAGDGWADFYFVEQTLKNNGLLTIVDIDQLAINNCRIVLSDYGHAINFLVGDGKDFIGKAQWDLIYLDGGPSPKEMLDQFELIDLDKTFVLIDDMGDKGLYLKEKYQHKIKMIQVNYVHQMAYCSPVNLDKEFEVLVKNLYNNRIVV